MVTFSSHASPLIFVSEGQFAALFWSHNSVPQTAHSTFSSPRSVAGSRAQGWLLLGRQLLSSCWRLLGLSPYLQNSDISPEWVMGKRLPVGPLRTRGEGKALLFSLWSLPFLLWSPAIPIKGVLPSFACPPHRGPSPAQISPVREGTPAPGSLAALLAHSRLVSGLTASVLRCSPRILLPPKSLLLLGFSSSGAAWAWMPYSPESPCRS